LACIPVYFIFGIVYSLVYIYLDVIKSSVIVPPIEVTRLINVLSGHAELHPVGVRVTSGAGAAGATAQARRTSASALIGCRSLRHE